MAEAPSYQLSVLVVEDHEDGAASLAQLLRLYGNRVVVALTGQAALELAVCDPPDVALVDIWLPDIDGWAVAQALRNPSAGRGKRPFLVAVTGCGTPADQERSAEAGFDLHLIKPVDPGVLVGLLDRFRQVLAHTTGEFGLYDWEPATPAATPPEPRKR